MFSAAKYYLRFGFVVLAFSLMVCVHAASLTASLGRSTAMVGESVQFALIFEGIQPRSMPQMPAVPGLQMQYTGEKRQISTIQNVTKDQYLLNFQITATQEGTFTIPSIRTVVNGVNLATQPVILTVKKADPDAGAQFAFLKLNLPRNEVYLGETIPIEVQLYIVNGNVSEMPELKSDGFLISKTAKPSQTRVEFRGQTYHLVSVPMAVTAAKAGQLSFGPASWHVILHLPVNRRRGANPLDMFPPDFADVFGARYEQREATLLSETNLVNVLPIPRTNMPASFNGAVGSFNVSTELSSTNVTAGDPITLRVRIEGKGAFDNLALPAFSWPDFKLYPPTSTLTNTDVLGLEGVKTFEQIVIPQNSTIKEFPAIEFSFFDPEAKRFRTITNASVPILVKPSAAQQLAAGAVKNATNSDNAPPPEPTDIVHIKASPGKFVTSARPLVLQPWFLGLQGVPVAAWLALTFNRRRVDRLANDPKRQRQIRVAQFTRETLSDLESHAANNNAEEFFSAVFRLLQEQLGLRLDLPANSVTEAVLENPNAPLSDSVRDDLRGLFEMCNQARYAPNAKPGELAAVIPRIRAALAELEGRA